MAGYTLPDLRYDYGALEPHIAGKIMELHHDKHHAAYVKNANAVVEQLDEARDRSDFTRLAALERALAFNLSGHILHSILWMNLTPKGGERPEGELARVIDHDFGGFDKPSNSSTRSRRLSWVPVGPPWCGNRSDSAS